MLSTDNRLTVCKFQHVVNLYSRHRYFEHPDSPWLIVQISASLRKLEKQVNSPSNKKQTQL